MFLNIQNIFIKSESCRYISIFENMTKHYVTPDEITMMQLFQQLTLDQCVELFKQNYGNYSKFLRNKLYIIIAAKYINLNTK